MTKGSHTAFWQGEYMDNILPSVFETVGLGVFFFYLIRGLKQKITSLESTISIQGKTLDVMERRVQETQKVGDIYKNLMSDLPKDIDNFKTVLSKTKDETIIELRNQNEIAKRKLEEAQKQIEGSKNSPETIARHMKVLKNLLSKPTPDPFYPVHYELLQVCEFGGRSLEQSVPLILDSKTVEEFLARAGYLIVVTNDNKTLRAMFGNKTTPRGIPLVSACMSDSEKGWFMITNDEFYITPEKMSALKDEFRAVKAIV